MRAFVQHFRLLVLLLAYTVQTGFSERTQPFRWNRPGVNLGVHGGRLRKSYNDLTIPERQLYIEAVQISKERGLYDIFVGIHSSSSSHVQAHGTAAFYPWHRKFLLEFENMLRSLDPKFRRVTIPYWDWSQELAVCQMINTNKVLSGKIGTCNSYEDVGSILTDFGGKGDTGEDNCVTKGPFSDPIIWKDWKDEKCLQRGSAWNTGVKKGSTRHFREGFKSAKSWFDRTFNRFLKDENPEPKTADRTASAVGSVVSHLALTAIVTSSPNYAVFQSMSQLGPHNTAHVHIGGHMGRKGSPQDPLFFSHHAFMDKLWDAHQHCHDTKYSVWMPDEIHNVYADTEMLFCFPWDMVSEKSWVKRNSDTGGLLEYGANQQKGSGHCAEDEILIDSNSLSSWNDNSKIEDYINNINLPGERNNVIYWPDESDRMTERLNPRLCTVTQVQKAAMANMANAFKRWPKIPSLPFGPGAMLKALTKNLVRSTVPLVNVLGVEGAILALCRSPILKKQAEPTFPLKQFKNLMPLSSIEEMEQSCFDSPQTCGALSVCKRLALKHQHAADMECKSKQYKECERADVCVWFDGKSGGKCT